MHKVSNLQGSDRHHGGFTLIEMIIVLVVIAILAAIIAPEWVDLHQEAEKASADGVYAAAQSATGINFAAMRAGRMGAAPIVDGATLIQAMESRPLGWNDSGNAMSFLGKSGVLYAISVARTESETSKAMLSKNW
ncbi:MAG: prepilin-type N-terminal cleavage/methylation domain-containing protein [Magnetococcales bacterium]|nr:prepilin-type N-terminal cleavage/methylation domain-containing protein [Magnetococcales bacterium]